jgi:hypothetical protein
MASVTFDAGEHKYYVGSRELPSVTQILKSVGMYEAFYSKEEHRLRGQAVHTACRLICEGRYREEGTHRVVVPFARACQRFIEATGYKQIAAEVPMGSVALGYAGTADGWGMVGDQIWLVDFKSGNPPALAGAQLAAYELLLAEQGVAVGSRKIVHLSDDERFRVLSFDETRWKSVWRSALNVYNIRKEFNLLPKG